MATSLKTMKMNTTVASIKEKKIKSEDVLTFTLKIAVKSALLLRKKQKKLSSLKITKKMAQGIASNADFESEKLIIDQIKKEYPTHFILAEESAFKEFKGEMGRYQFLKEKEWVWVIDPLDGTNNYLNGLDYYGVCIALVHYGVPQVGVVLRPSNGDCFYAIKGKGSKMIRFSSDFKTHSRPEKLFKAKSKSKLKDSLLVTGFVSEKGQMFDQEFSFFKQLIPKSRGIRRMGSAALDLCYVSKGIFDCFWEKGLAAWDVAAAGLICEEAGVKVTDYDGQSFHPFQASIVACRSPLHKEFLSLLRNRL